MQITRGGKLKARKGVNVPDIDAWLRPMEGAGGELSENVGSQLELRIEFPNQVHPGANEKGNQPFWNMLKN